MTWKVTMKQCFRFHSSKMFPVVEKFPLRPHSLTGEGVQPPSVFRNHYTQQREKSGELAEKYLCVCVCLAGLYLVFWCVLLPSPQTPAVALQTNSKASVLHDWRDWGQILTWALALFCHVRWRGWKCQGELCFLAQISLWKVAGRPPRKLPVDEHEGNTGTSHLLTIHRVEQRFLSAR